jgi:hypothetical protein
MASVGDTFADATQGVAAMAITVDASISLSSRTFFSFPVLIRGHELNPAKALRPDLPTDERRLAGGRGRILFPRGPREVMIFPQSG